MQPNRRLMGVLLGLAVPLAACGQEAAEAGHEPPAVIEEDDGSEFTRIRLTSKAEERLALETAPIESVGSGQTAVPYGAVFYGTDGETWLYMSPEPLVFVRAPISVVRIEDDTAILSESPPVGTMVATVAVAELFGVETGLGGAGH